MIPHERSLVEKFADKPFAIVGVNSDGDRDELRKIQEREGITWRSFWDGGGTSGPIATAWNVHAWPTIYVLDHRGVIRHRNLRGEALERAVEQLLAAMEEEQ
jgi:hypothetical protein